jgi:DNA-binding transcriptional MocR family regulator
MISFRVDGRSGVPPYLQIVQQVRQALRMGVLTVGDQLPTVREVVAAVAVNPNTVLKAATSSAKAWSRPAPGRARSSRACRQGRRQASIPGSAGPSRTGCARPASPGLTTNRSSHCCA